MSNGDDQTTIEYGKEEDHGIQSEELTKKGRGALKTKVTVASKRLNALLKDKDSTRQQVTDQLQRLRDEFKAFSTYHGKLHVNFTDLDERLSANYFQLAETKFHTHVMLAENWLECEEKGIQPEQESSSSSEEEEHGDSQGGTAQVEVHRTLGGAIVEPVNLEDDRRRDQPPPRGPSVSPARTPPPRVRQDGPTEAQLTLSILQQMQEQMTRFNDFMQKSIRPAESTPIRGVSGRPPVSRRAAYGGTPGLAGLSTIQEGEDLSSGQREEELRAIRSMAESFKLMAEKQATGVTTLVQEPGVKLPKFKMFSFSGDPIDYLPFIRAFENQIESKISDPATLLGILIDNTKGALQDRLRFCAVEHQPAQAYRQAREILSSKYGKFEDLSQAWMDRVAKFPKIVSVKDLEDFNSLLHNCMATLNTMNQLKDFETKSNLMSIIGKLPRAMKGRWQKKVVDIREDESRSATLRDLIRLLERYYLEKSDPIYGGTLDEGSPEKSARTQTRASSTRSVSQLSYNVSNPGVGDEYVESIHREQAPGRGTGRHVTLVCNCCGGSHTLYRCPTFKDMLPPDRKRLVEEKGACSNCFHPRHRVEECRSEHRCHVCRSKHHTMLHIDGTQSVNAAETVHVEDEIPSIVTNTVVRGRVALPVVAVLAKNVKGEYVRIYALLDQGSTCSLCTESLVNRLGIDTQPHLTTINTVNKSSYAVKCGRADIQIKSLHNNQEYDLKSVVTRPTLNLSSKCRAYQEDLDRWPHLAGISFPTADVDEVDLLIGYSHPRFLDHRQTRRAPNGLGPRGIETLLGWFVGGPLEDEVANDISCNTIIMSDLWSDIAGGEEPDLCNVTVEGASELDQPPGVQIVPTIDDNLEAKVEQFWKVDGTQPLRERVELSRDEQKVIDEWTRGMHHDGKHYHVSIPFKNRDEHIPDNREQAIQWLHTLGRRLSRRPRSLRHYQGGMMKYMLQDIAEEVPEEEIYSNPGKTWYLLFHTVYSEKKPDDPRMVFNPSHKYRGVCLNDFVYPGPDLMNHLLDVLLKFRQDRVALQGDVEGMFNQIFVKIRDRDVQRFLFWENGIPGGRIITYRMKTHIFGGVWSPSCANFTLKRVAEDFGEGFQEETRKTVREKFYVDDGLASKSTTEKTAQLAGELDRMLAKGGFNFTKILSNDPGVLKAVPEKKLARSVDVSTLTFGPDDVASVLGCGWKPLMDRLVYKTLVPTGSDTRRGVLSTMSSIYDPMGLITPMVIRAKTVFQEACRRKIAWDESLPDDLKLKWNEWKASLENMDRISFQRCFLPEGYTLEDDLTFELHIFGDASQAAYGAVGYLRTLKDGKPVGVCLVMAKGKLAPIRTLSIPRLELTAAELAVLLEQLLQRALELDISKTYYWTDSMIVIWYLLNSAKRYKTFVHNRVIFIDSHTNLLQWRHVPSSLNPADILSRGMGPLELAGSELWARGPAFLMLDESQWPQTPRKVEVEESILELKQESAMAVEEFDEIVLGIQHMSPAEVVNAVRDGVNDYNNCLAQAYIDHWSSWHKLRRNVIYLVRALRWSRLKRKGQLTKRALEHLRRPITTKSLREVELGICAFVQREMYTPSGSIDDKYLKLSPFVQGGIICVGGRLRRSDLHPHHKHPILLPPCQPARVFLSKEHLEQGHASEYRMLSESRKSFWIWKAKQIIGDITRRCIPCRRLRVRMLEPRMADLHDLRVRGDDRPFANSGVDYFGPLVVRVGRVDRKRYGCLFTCLRTRAVHLELSWSLDMDSCIKAILRFAARRGMPEELSSDNGTNFVGAHGAMVRAIQYWNSDKLHSYFLQRGCNWRFNPPAASHMGGCWERMIRSVRAILVTLSDEQKMTEESLLTSLCVIEDILNNRPITPVSPDADDCAALTPNHLLRLDTSVKVPVAVTDEKDAYRRRWMQVQHVCNVFWQRWRNDYLPTLQARNKWNKEQRSLSVGDLVVLRDDQVARNFWPLGRVVQTYPDDQGVVRSVDVKTARGTLRRPVVKIGLLEGYG